MALTLAEFIEQLAAHIAHERGWPREDAKHWVETRMAEARLEYRDAGAPLGDTEQGFLAWIQPRPQPPTA